MKDPKRKIPYNYTSADDDQIIAHLFGPKILAIVHSLDARTDTGRSARLLRRFMGDLFILQRNPFLFQELVEHPLQRRRLFKEYQNDLDTIEAHARHEEVLHVLESCRSALGELKAHIRTLFATQQRILLALRPVVGRENIYFDPFNITAHATDATDWRRFTPVAVVRPVKERQVAELVKRIRKLNFTIIPRGAGTGLTGGATPLTPNSIIINTEKLNRHLGITEHQTKDGRTYHAMELESGVVTQDAKDRAKARGLIFATDPTSAWACTIGGNLAENAGGKTAVLYGTAIDNVLSYKIAMPDGESYRVDRQDHPLRKILPDDTLVFTITDAQGRLTETIVLPAAQVRGKGLGKDVTNKTLSGLPGLQKEGCDGIITSARFILYPEFEFKKTCCIEFFGNDMTEAGQVITAVSSAFENQDPALMALEHFDEEYIKAIKYKTKQSIGNRLKAVLLIDMVSNEAQSLDRGMGLIEEILAPYDKTGLTIAKDNAEAARFWEDRKRLGAIAAHTNAFKLNEDIVLPIPALADFVRYVDETNLSEKQYNQERIIHSIVEYLDTAKPMADPEWLTKKVGQAKDLAYSIRKKLSMASRDALEAEIHSKNFYTQVRESLRGYSLIQENLERIYDTTRKRLIVIATHMHAGDGNVHVNIPVLSNDREMMERANQTADKVMEKTVELGGAVSGEHGIGVTKIKHLSPARRAEFEAYRNERDPDRIMNPGKLSDPDIMDKVFTPSFNLLELEARILKHGSLSDLALKVANCVRCGKCKPQCPVFYPEKNMFFHPRNKNLAIGSLIEALLYISQRTQSTAFKILKNLEEIADHCTICHKCLDKCPVNIDSGQISIEERQILKSSKFKRTPLSTKTTLKYLASKDPGTNRTLRAGLLGVGGTLQRTGSAVLGPLARTRSMSRTRWAQLLKSPVSKAAARTLRGYLPKTRKNQALLLEPEGEAQSTVFYFPGCGSERIFSKISMAAIFLLLNQGHRVILPPPFLCCGYPLRVNAQKAVYDRVSLENIIIFTQIRDYFQDLSFEACIVSCGTCMESLERMEISAVFDCDVQDISQYLLSRHPLPELGEREGAYLYHAPCHDSLKAGAVSLLKDQGVDLDPVPFCCSEAGTMAISRPDISHNMLMRKKDAVKSGLESENLEKEKGKAKILTNCPSCLQGLGRHGKLGITPVHMAEELACRYGGKDWVSQFKQMVKDAKPVRF